MKTKFGIGVVAVAFACLVTACGGGSESKVDCKAVGEQVSKIMTDAVSNSGSNLDSMDANYKSAASKIRTLADKYDGNLKSALKDLADALDNPTTQESMQKIQGFQSKLHSACVG